MIHLQFEQQARETPGAIAVELEDERITYQELSKRSTWLAQSLLKTYNIQPQTVIGLYIDPCVDMIVAILAILKLNCSYMPLDPERPSSHTETVIKDSRTPLVLTRSIVSVDLAPLLPYTQVHCLDQVQSPGNGTEEISNTDISSSLTPSEQVAYVIYTSGSTGTPQGVMVPHSGVCNLASFNKSLFHLGTDVRILQYASISFDASVFEIFSALLTGSTIVLARRESILPGSPLVNFLESKKINLILLPPSSLVVINEEADRLKHLRVIIVGGEKCPLNLAKTWVRSYRSLFNAYGPTEATVYATIYKCQVDEKHESVPIGSTLPGMYIELLDENGNKVKRGEVGEICIGGTGVALGYLGQPAATKKRFFYDEENKCQVFRTRDLGRQLPDGNLEFMGRIDNQIKVRGYRIELEAIENVICQHMWVESCVVIVRDDIIQEQQNLVAFVIPKKEAISSHKQAAIITQLSRHAKSKLPHYMNPSFYVIVDSLPLMSNGSKVNRKALLRYDLSHLIPHEQADTEFSSDTERVIASVFSDVLRVPVSSNDNFFELGGNSLLAATLVRKLEKKLDKQLMVSLLFRKPSVKALAEVIENSVAVPNSEQSSFVEQVDYIAEASLDESIVPPKMRGDELMDLKSLEGRNATMQVFLTGATGFLGGNIVAELLQESPNIFVHCLVRAKDPESGKQRVIDNLKHLRMWQDSFVDRIGAVPGNLEKPLLGMERETFEQLASKTDVIYHVAADISYVKSYNAIKGVNVFGTHEMLRFAASGNKYKPFHYVSSMCIYGPYHHFLGKKLLTEKDDYRQSMPYIYTENGYVRSKWIAEYMVRTALDRGLPIIIYRPGFIQASSKTGVPNTTDFLFRLIKGCVQLGCYPDMPFKYWLTTPVDYVSKALVHISLIKYRETKENTFHLIPKRTKEPSTVQMFEILEKIGYPLQKVSIKCWHEELEKILDEDKYENALHPVVMFVIEKVYANRNTILELHYNTPDCTDDNVDEILKGTNIVCPALDEKLMWFYVSQYIEQGSMDPPPSPISN
jgi:amino acid adenylation domain-containing protein/thioester reductase-like protein